MKKKADASLSRSPSGVCWPQEWEQALQPDASSVQAVEQTEPVEGVVYRTKADFLGTQMDAGFVFVSVPYSELPTLREVRLYTVTESGSEAFAGLCEKWEGWLSEREIPVSKSSSSAADGIATPEELERLGESAKSLPSAGSPVKRESCRIQTTRDTRDLPQPYRDRLNEAYAGLTGMLAGEIPPVDAGDVDYAVMLQKTLSECLMECVTWEETGESLLTVTLDGAGMAEVLSCIHIYEREKQA